MNNTADGDQLMSSDAADNDQWLVVVVYMQCGTGCAVWYRLCSVAQVLNNRSTGSVRLWFSYFYLLIRVAGRGKERGS